MTSAPVLLQGISKHYDGTTVLHDLDLAVAGGELLALLGPSGFGKTTTLRVLAGFEAPDSGTVRIGARDVTTAPVSKRGIGIVFQSYSLFPHLSALDNVGWGLRVRRMSAAARTARATELLDLVGLVDHTHQYPAQLSGGQQQRVALARALAIEPDVLLLDEPLSALDAKVRVQLREEIRRIQREAGTTTVMVTHHQEEALTMADRIAVMRAGRIEQLGTPEEIYRHPATPFVSTFVGAVNRIPASIDGDARIDVLDTTVRATTTIAAGGCWVHLRPEDIDVIPDERAKGVVLTVTRRVSHVSLAVGWPGLADPVRVDVGSRAAERFTEGTPVDLRVAVREALAEQR